MRFLKFFIFSLVLFSKPIFPDENAIAINYTATLDNSTLLFLEDNSIWELFNFEYRSRTWTEWWNSVQLQKDDNFVWKSSDWYVNDYVEFDNANRYSFLTDSLSTQNQNVVRSYPYVLRDLNTGKIAFAMPISIATLIDKFIFIANEQYKIGHKEGYDKGYDNGFLDGDDKGYKEGYNIGYDMGYDRGYKDGSSY